MLKLNLDNDIAQLGEFKYPYETMTLHFHQSKSVNAFLYLPK